MFYSICYLCVYNGLTNCTLQTLCIYVTYVKFSGTYQQHFNHCLDTHSLQHAGLQSSPFITMQQVKYMVNQGRKPQKRKALSGGEKKTCIVLPVIFSTHTKDKQRKVILKIKRRRKTYVYGNKGTYKYKWKTM